MQNASKITRDEFLQSRYLKITLIDVEKRVLHHTRYIIEVVLDSKSIVSYKKLSQIKKFSEQLDNKFGMKEFVMETRIRTSQQYKQIENLFKKINSGYLLSKENENEKQVQKRNQIRHYLYNLLFCSFDQHHSSEEDNEIKEKEKQSSRTFENTMAATKKEEFAVGEGDRVEREKTEGRDFRNVIKNIYKPKKDGDELRRGEFIKSIKTIWVLEKEQWNERSYQLTDNCLIIIQNQQLYKQIIPLKRLDINLIETPFYLIRINHTLFNKPIEIRLSDGAKTDTDLEHLNQYLALFTSLKEISYKNEYNIYNFIGISINNKKNKIITQAEKKPAKELQIKLTHESESFNFQMLIDSTTVIQIPIINNYGKIQVQVIECKEMGILPNFRENSINFTLPIQNIYDQVFNEKPKRKTPQMRYHLLQSKQCNYLIKLDYFQRTNRTSYYSCKTKDKFQGQQIPQEFTRDQFRIQKNRFKRIIYSVEEYLTYFKELKNFEYPLKSYIFYCILLWTILLFDANYIIHYIISTICCIFAYCHPSTPSYYREILIIFNLTELVQKISRKLREGAHMPVFRVCTKKQVEKKLFLERFEMSKKNKRNIYKKYKRLQQILLRGQLWLTEFVTISQKIKNTFLWYHHKKTKELLLLLLAALCIIYFIPIRIMMLVLLYRTYNKGVLHHTKVRNINRIILYQIFKLCIDENNFSDVKGYLTQNSKPIDRKLVSQYSSFEKKIKEYLDEILQIDYDNEIFIQARTIGQLINFLSDCKKRFVIPQEICQKYKFNLEWSTNISTIAKIMLVVYGFLINIPSDRNILGVKTQIDKNQAQNESQDEFEN